MSRSWERKVRKNMSHLNKQQKKQGKGGSVLGAERKDRFVGRNYMAPVLLLIFVALYSVVMWNDPKFEATTMFWVTIALYIGLAALFFFRKPYLTIGKDYVQTRRLTGDKRIQASGIKQIAVQKGIVMITPVKGASWSFTRLINRYPTGEMAEKMKEFAAKHNIPFSEKE
ncbi:hypothetical protein M6D81_05700 [Paenibacillus sp. J5C_2022]|uniref:hypothetical protein n=1 Tax=Paenibacillus sp. J5C2022 TaxID=2977129 RepID=UPI0021D33D41|nr:hypothetical protein [Paenibacillus sp. J5C2022]MCU6708201.1 hypothetical protein [Paenibacillus sp. J5C2022]